MIRLKLSEHYCIILFISPSANTCQVEEKVVKPRRTDSFGDQFQNKPIVWPLFLCCSVLYCVSCSFILYYFEFFLSVLF